MFWDSRKNLESVVHSWTGSPDSITVSFSYFTSMFVSLSICLSLCLSVCVYQGCQNWSLHTAGHVNVNSFVWNVHCCYLTLDVSSSRVKDTLGRTSTPAFSVDSELLRYFPGHADAFQILLCGVYPVLSWSSRLCFCTAYIPVYSMSWKSVVVHSQNVPEPSHSFMMRFIFSSCVCALTLSLLLIAKC